jgi:ATP-dependent RNA helicase DDX46/PRP5
VIGGRSVASSDITQIVEVREADTKFRRLLEILGKWYQSGNILVFVDKQEMVDNMFRQLVDSGYSCLALHGGMDQSDREYTISDFKNKLRTLMVATSVVSRGLDVKDLILVINYTCPNHMEDYVHRVGRTGRAGAKGTAITFIQPDEAKFSIELVKALHASKQTVSPELQAMSDAFWEKVKAGEEKYYAADGYAKSKGFKFDEQEEMANMAQTQMERQGAMASEGLLDENEAAAFFQQKDAEEREEKEKKEKSKGPLGKAEMDPVQRQMAAALNRAKHIASLLATSGSSAPPQPMVIAALNRAKHIASLLATSGSSAPPQVIGDDGKPTRDDYHRMELEINDFPQHARFKVTQRLTLDNIMDQTDTYVCVKGVFVPPGRKPQQGERKIYLFIEGRSEIGIARAKQDLMRVLEEAAANARPDAETYARYTV